MPTDLFDYVDTDPEQKSYVKAAIQSVGDNITLDDLTKLLSQRKEKMSPETFDEMHSIIIGRRLELAEELRQKRSNNGKRIALTSNHNTAVSNRVGAASIVFLVTNIALTTAMYTLLILSKFLNN